MVAVFDYSLANANVCGYDTSSSDDEGGIRWLQSYGDVQLSPLVSSHLAAT